MFIFSVKIENVEQLQLSKCKTFDVNCRWWNAKQMIDRKVFNNSGMFEDSDERQAR
jgi:hypothetical protein